MNKEDYESVRNMLKRVEDRIDELDLRMEALEVMMNEDEGPTIIE